MCVCVFLRKHNNTHWIQNGHWESASDTLLKPKSANFFLSEPGDASVAACGSDACAWPSFARAPMLLQFPPINFSRSDCKLNLKEQDEFKSTLKHRVCVNQICRKFIDDFHCNQQITSRKDSCDITSGRSGRSEKSTRIGERVDHYRDLQRQQQDEI